jgi:hypothetical protein
MVCTSDIDWTKRELTLYKGEVGLFGARVPESATLSVVWGNLDAAKFLSELLPDLLMRSHCFLSRPIGIEESKIMEGQIKTAFSEID